jgi:hypothetical protein
MSVLESEITFSNAENEYQAGVQIYTLWLPLCRRINAWVQYDTRSETGEGDYQVIYSEDKIVWGTFDHAVDKALDLSKKVIDTADPTG